MRSVSVIGIGETKMGVFPDKSLKELIKEAGSKAINDAGIDKGLIEALYIGNFNSSYLCNQSHMGALASEVLELGNIPTLRTENACASGGLAFRYGYLAVASGLYDVVLVGGVEKMTHRETEVVTSALASASDGTTEFEIGATFPSLFALIANRHMYEYGTTREQMAMVAVQNHDNALLNPNAQMHKKLTIEKVVTGFPVAYPFTVFDCSLITDGAVFTVLAATEVAEKLTQKPLVEIIGSGHAGDTLTLASKKIITEFPATIKAAKEAYEMANVKPEDIDFAEVHDCFTITQIIHTEDLGFFEKGKGGFAVEEGLTAINGKIPINPSGGLKAKGHPIGATGLSQVYEAVTQLRGEAGERQVKNAEIGLTHNIGGTASTCCVHIFRRR
ncbi:thiolase domain-containing protein [Anaerobranca gottschalkii]|uniref:Acetyl-CoA C-acetyltransferase n=1 Tax=Anaerobranca gottschalkii DSM 13577 TaxID=1120990 RepID=A0A1I0A048_9FIRM|nr:thiolase domain-containing protein [Anaerobranca gottschalkii]SES87478.1 acetyl-CoA C-acetyltransferase [Anaerobranca gottschalkii DSM 13577]